MKRKESAALAKRVKRLERRVKALESARMWEPLASTQIEGPEFDPHALLRECVADWMHGWDEGEDWSRRGYL